MIDRNLQIQHLIGNENALSKLQITPITDEPQLPISESICKKFDLQKV